MKLIRIINAYMVTTELMKRKLNNKLSYALYMLKKEIEPNYEYFSVKEQDLVAKYGKSGNDGIEWNSDEAKANFVKERGELMDMDIDASIKVRKAPVPDEIEGVFFEALDGFIEFEVDDDNS